MKQALERWWKRWMRAAMVVFALFVSVVCDRGWMKKGWKSKGGRG